MTATDLRKLQRAHERAAVKAKAAQEARNAGVRAALAEGWSHAALAHTLGLSRGRIGQIVGPGSVPAGRRVVHHIDGNPLNNDPANLRIMDADEGLTS